jgi:pimeloyl-ACP methyl ester carboxylesterase
MYRTLTYRTLTALAVAATLAAPTPDDRGRPVILLLHGRGLLDRDTTAMRRLWLESLTEGARRIGRDVPLDARDVRLVWYADVLDPRSSAGCDYASSDPRARRASEADPDVRTVVSVVGGLFGAITSLVADSEAGSQLRGLAADASFLTDTRKRCASEQRLADAIARARSEGRPVILVAHSLGSIVAYDYLSSRGDSTLVRRLITLGSPLGSADLRQLLLGGDSTDTLSLPKTVLGWINIRNDGDPFATSVTVGRDIWEPVSNAAADPHDMVGYLGNSVTAGLVLGAWCDAFASPVPPHCAEFVRGSP